MGITIYYRFARREEPNRLLDRLAAIATRLNMKIVERSWNKLILDPGEHSEAISLQWHKVKTIRKRAPDWDYQLAALDDLGELDDQMWFCADFTKTQYAGVKVHVSVVELLRFVAGRCTKVLVSDDADYYESIGNAAALERLAAAFSRSREAVSRVAATLKETFENIDTPDK